MKLADLPDNSTRHEQIKPSAASNWPRALMSLGFGLLAVLLCYMEDVRNVVLTWYSVGTYAHGFLVYPVSAWLVWRQRRALATQAPQPFPPAVLGLALLSLVWLAGYLSNTQTLREFALVASVPVVVWAVLGTAVVRIILFPLAMTIFAWPVGEFFVPHMINYTADFTVFALRQSGVPVYREGNFFVIPTGSWSVVEGCSGIRYLIASVYGGSIFAYLSFSNWKRRLPFMLAAVVVPILANWLRAYMIVMLAHLSNNKIAAGVDHLIYGWIFFGVVITILFYIGSRFSDAHLSETAPPLNAFTVPEFATRFGTVALLAVLFAAIGPSIAEGIERFSPVPNPSISLELPMPTSGWSVSPVKVSDWEPSFESPTFHMQTALAKNERAVGLHLAYFRNQESKRKMLTYVSTTLADYNKMGWRTLERHTLPVTAGEATLNVIERRLRSEGQNLLSWQWYWVGRRDTVSFWEAKIAEARARLLMQGDDAASIVIYTPYDDDPASARRLLQAFVTDTYSVLQRALNDAADR